MSAPATPYYLIDEQKLVRNLERIRQVREQAGAKSLLALKCFSTWCVFDLMREYMDGTTSSSLYEAKLGKETFGKETHAYSVAYPPEEVEELKSFADKIIFNSVSQLKRYQKVVAGMNIGIRINPGVSYSHFDLADPARRFSRLGVSDKKALQEIAPLIRGAMFHFNCENDNFDQLSETLDLLGKRYRKLLQQLEWISLGGGIFFTKDGYPLDRFCDKLKSFSDTHGLQIYLEPGEAAITRSTELVTTVLDVVKNRRTIAIVDASIEPHMLDLLIYRLEAQIAHPGPGQHPVTIAGRSCLAGDVFCTTRLSRVPKAGDTIRIADAAGYTMVKKNWFNGLPMPAIAVRRLDNTIETIRTFSYDDYKKSLS
ncbi:MAG: carboxynorspermidine decarboxylase [Planctomycetes bacterium]|nr:carboxynorspermidine decarboxylase [Planctomycetota bacterium]